MTLLSINALRFLDWAPYTVDLAEGEMICIVGESGSGKSLLLRAIADLIPNEGEIRLGEKSRSETKPTDWRRQVGYLPAEILWWDNSVRAHFEDGLDPALVWRLGLPEAVGEWDTTRLSMGERQRLGLARLLDRQPRVLLLDEPTSNLDAVASNRVESLIREYIAEDNRCGFWVSHNEEQAKRLGGRFFRMKGKTLVEEAL